MEKTVVYKKRYANSTRAKAQANAQEAIEKAFTNAEKLIDKKGGNITLAFKDDPVKSTLSVNITGPTELMNAFTPIFKDWKQVKHVRIHNTVSRRLYNGRNNLGVPHGPTVNRNITPSFLGEISEYANFKGLPIANMAKYHWNRTAKRNRHGRIYNTNSASTFAAFQALLHNEGPSAVANFARTVQEAERLVDRYTAEEIKNAIIENPKIGKDELLKIGQGAYMYVAKPIFEGEKDSNQLSREALEYVPTVIDRFWGLRSRF